MEKNRRIALGQTGKAKTWSSPSKWHIGKRKNSGNRRKDPQPERKPSSSLDRTDRPNPKDVKVQGSSKVLEESGTISRKAKRCLRGGGGALLGDVNGPGYAGWGGGNRGLLSVSQQPWKTLGTPWTTHTRALQNQVLSAGKSLRPNLGRNGGFTRLGKGLHKGGAIWEAKTILFKDGGPPPNINRAKEERIKNNRFSRKWTITKKKEGLKGKPIVQRGYPTFAQEEKKKV